MRRPYVTRCVPPVAPALLIGATLLGCVVLRRPTDVAYDLGNAVQTRDVAHGEALSSPSAYSVLASARLPWILLDGCEPDVGGGVRCTFTPQGCEQRYDAALTIHLEAVAKERYHVTAAAATGLFRSVVDPDFGTEFFVVPCGLELMFSMEPYTELGPFLLSELYSTALVPWPYALPPRIRADTALAMSRLAVNRGAIDTAIADLQQALVPGEDTEGVVTTAVIEAGFVLGLHVSPSNRVDPTQPYARPVWHHDADAYPTDTARLRRGIALLDFAMGVPHPGFNWHQVAVLGQRGHNITFTHTPSIAAMEEMNGLAHYMFGRALMDVATRVPTCARWAAAHDALGTAYAYLTKVPQVDQADDADARTVKIIQPLVQRADSTRLRVCHAST